MKSLFVVVVVAVVCLWPMVGITSDWKQYPYYPKQANLSFPKDEGAHKAKLLEWWYVVIHAKGETTGDEYSILVTHFSNRFRFFDVTNISANVHLSGTTNGRIKAAEGYLDVRQQTPWGTDIMRTKRTQAGGLIPFEYEMLTHHSSMGLQAELVAQKPPMMVGGDAYVQIGKSGWSWYYSLSRLEVRGRLTFNGITENISGIGWMDHQWGPFLISPVELGGVFESYEWFCVQLDDGTEMMISNIYDRKYRLPQTAAYGGVGIYYKDGSMDGVVKKTFVRTKYWFDPDSKTYMSMGWRLIIPEMDTDLILTPKIENQMVSFPLGGSFWEGAMRVEGKLRGKPVNGVGFGELMHHFQVPKLQLSRMRASYSASQILKIKWRVANPDEGNPLTYDVDLLVDGKSYPLARELRTDWYQFRLKEALVAHNVKQVSNRTKFGLRVVAHSVDGVIRSEKHSETFVLVP